MLLYILPLDLVLLIKNWILYSFDLEKPQKTNDIIFETTQLSNWQLISRFKDMYDTGREAWVGNYCERVAYKACLK